MEAYQLLKPYRKQIAVSFGLLVVLTGCMVLAGCQTEAQETTSAPKLLSQPQTKERYLQCTQTYPDTMSKNWADCLSGKAMTKAEACTAAHEFLGNPYMSDWEKAAMLETMKNRGCL